MNKKKERMKKEGRKRKEKRERKEKEKERGKEKKEKEKLLLSLKTKLLAPQEGPHLCFYSVPLSLLYLWARKLFSSRIIYGILFILQYFTQMLPS